MLVQNVNPMMILISAKYVLFLIFFIIFLYEDLKIHSIYNQVFIVYFVIGIMIFLMSNSFNLSNTKAINIKYIYETVLSIFVGFVIYILSIISKEAIGKGDALYFIINGFYLSFIENLLLLMLGLLVSMIISIIVYVKNKGKVKKLAIPFIPCLLPAILWRIICIQ